MKKLCFSIPLFALFVMASVTAHAETKIGVAISLFDDMWLTTLRHGMQSYADKLGDVKLTFEDAGGDIGQTAKPNPEFHRLESRRDSCRNTG